MLYEVSMEGSGEGREVQAGHFLEQVSTTGSWGQSYWGLALTPQLSHCSQQGSGHSYPPTPLIFSPGLLPVLPALFLAFPVCARQALMTIKYTRAELCLSSNLPVG